MTEPQDAVRILESRGIMVQIIHLPTKPQSIFYRVRSHGNIEYQISNSELMQLMKYDQLNWDSIKLLVESKNS